jgi:hypothetical protein
MGIDVHALNFLKYVAKKREFGSVATIGRQSLLVPRGELARILGIPKKDSEFGLYSEELLKKNFGATAVDSYDFSDYEGATHIADMGKPIVSEKQYDTIIDCGCAEHIFDAAQALRNISCLCASGGQILHVLPANNFCGHGFWQFSPELFFSLYSVASGYLETEVFLADLCDETKWFEVQPPSHGRRAEVRSSNPLHVMCRTIKGTTVFPESVQQSDYVHIWDNCSYARQHQTELVRTLKGMIKARPSLHRLAVSSLSFTKSLFDSIANPTCLSDRNPHLRKLNVSDLLMN